MRLIFYATTALALLVPASTAFSSGVPRAKPTQQSVPPAEDETDTLSEAWRPLQAGAYDAWQAAMHNFDEVVRKSQQDILLTTVLPGAISGQQLIGTPIENAKEGRIGSISDLVLGNDNRVDAIVVSDGGFLGVGNAQVQVKPGLISIQRQKDGTLRARTNVTEAQLDKASSGVFVTRIETMREDLKDPKVKSVSRMIGATVVGPDNQPVGVVTDLLLSPVGEAQYALLAVGGIMGAGAKHVAVKASTLQFTSSRDAIKTKLSLSELQELAPIGRVIASSTGK